MTGRSRPSRAAWLRVMMVAGALYRATADHYRRVRESFASLDTPDDRLDLALEWGKVALDKGLVCNPDLGCGLIAGLGSSGTTDARQPMRTATV